MQAVSFYEQTFMDKMLLSIPKRETSVHAVLLHIHKVTMVKKQALPLLGIIPCLAVAYMFCATSGLLLQVRGMGVNIDTATEIAFMTAYALSFLYMTYVSDECTRQAVSKAQAIESLVLQQRDEEWRQVVGSLQAMAGMQHQSCGLFTLNVQFFISLFSSLITFTALLTQILTDVSAA